MSATVHRGMPDAAYRALPGLSVSELLNMRRSAAHYRYWLKRPREDTADMRLGRALHTAVLEPAAFDSRHPVYTGRTRSGKGWLDFVAAHPAAGEDNILTADAAADVRVMAAAVMAHPHAGPLVRALSDVELSIEFARAGRPCKARLDGLLQDGWDTKRSGAVVFELKTSRFGEERRFASDAWERAYHVRGAWYCGALTEAGIQCERHVTVAVDKQEPPEVAVYEYEPDVLFEGGAIAARLLDSLRVCEIENHWPTAHESGIRRLDRPRWANYEESDE